MTRATLAAPLEMPLDSDSLFQGLLDRLQFAKAAEAWSRCVSGLSAWEGEHLLIDQQSPERLAQHKKVVERLMQFGQICALIASYPEFEDVETAEMIHATQVVLKDKLRMWHGSRLSEAEADRILEEVFLSPELERLLNALWERDTCEPKHRARWKAIVERLISDACTTRPGLRREEFIDALTPRYQKFCRARKKPSSMPPQSLTFFVAPDRTVALTRTASR